MRAALYRRLKFGQIASVLQNASAFFALSKVGAGESRCAFLNTRDSRISFPGSYPLQQTHFGPKFVQQGRRRARVRSHRKTATEAARGTPPRAHAPNAVAAALTTSEEKHGRPL